MNAAWIKNYVQQYVARVANYAITGAATSAGAKDTVEGRAVGEDEKAYGLQVRRLWPFGHRSVPPAGCEGVVLRINAGRRSLVLIAAESAKYGPQDLKDGETATYDAAGSVIRLYQDGSLTVAAKGGGLVTLDKNGNATVSAPGDVVTLPGAGHQVRLGDDKPANLDYVVLFTALKAYLESHTHQPGSFAADGKPVAGISGGANEAFTAHSSNVVAKK